MHDCGFSQGKRFWATVYEVRRSSIGIIGLICEFELYGNAITDAMRM